MLAVGLGGKIPSLVYTELQHQPPHPIVVQATTAIVEKTVRAFYSIIAVVSTIAVVCCMERSIYLRHHLIVI